MTTEKKSIIAIVRSYLLDRIVVALEEIEGFPGLTVWDSMGFSSSNYKNDRLIDPFRPNKTLMIVADEDQVKTIVDTIRREAATGKKGDGIITVHSLTESTLI